jgi:hypothetical protein
MKKVLDQDPGNGITSRIRNTAKRSFNRDSGLKLNSVQDSLVSQFLGTDNSLNRNLRQSICRLNN